MADGRSTPKYPAELRAPRVRLVIENRANYASDNVGYHSIAAKLGCSSHTLHAWCIQAEHDADARPGCGSSGKARTKGLECENRELRTANGILTKASAYFAQAELDRPFCK